MVCTMPVIIGKAIIKIVIFPDNCIFFAIEEAEQSSQTEDAYSVIYPTPIIFNTEARIVLFNPAFSVSSPKDDIIVPIVSDNKINIVAPIATRTSGAISGFVETINR